MTTVKMTQSRIGESIVRAKKLPVRVAGCSKSFGTIDEAIAHAAANGMPVRLTAHGYPVLLAKAKGGAK